MVCALTLFLLAAEAAEEELDLEAVRRAAEAEAEKAVAEEEPKEVTFKSGGLGLQALNPEISVTGDFIAGTGLGHHHGEHEATDWDFNFRGLGVHFESYLDPYSRFKAAVHAAPPPHGVEIEEGYYTRYGIPGGNLTLGKFRQQFGVVNRWHKHALDYVDFPMPLMNMFGHHGLCQTGVSLDWSGSLGGASQGLNLQITNGENERMFGGNHGNRPSALAHYKLYHDLSPSTYMEFGLTGMVGWNNEWPISGTDPVEETRDSEVYGADLTLLWEPTGRMRYRNLEWRTEFYMANKNIIAPDGATGRDALNPWGIYTSLQTKASRTVDVGVRFDYYEPAVKSYADIDEDLSLHPLAVTESGAHRWLAAAYVTWWQSPFVKFRLEYNHEDGSGMGDPVDRVMFQCVFAAGPHKHERY